MIVRMWEAKAYPEGFADLLGWVCDVALPKIEVHPMHVSSEVFSSVEHRIVVISRWRGSDPVTLADPPSHLVAGRAKFWDFAPVDR